MMNPILTGLFGTSWNPTQNEEMVPILNDTYTTTAIAPHHHSNTFSVRVQFLPTTSAAASSLHQFNGIALLFLPILCLVGLIGNFLVCVAIATDRRLHNVTNYFLFSLALADLLVCCIVMPLSIVVEVRHGVWTWSVSMCLLYIYSDVFLCSASIVHMSVISLDRYLGISQPLRTRNKSKTLIFVKIAIVWIVTLLVSCPIAVLAIHDTSNILRDNQCMIFSSYYIVYGSTMTFLIPFCIMAVTYVRTTHLLKKQASILSQKANDKLNGNGLRRTMPHRKLGYVRTNSATTNTTQNGKTLGVNGRTMSNLSNAESFCDGNRLGTSRPSIKSNGHKVLEKASTINRWKSRTSNYLTNIAMRVGRRSSLQAASQDLANEHKATRVLAVVFICFFICWTPFFIANFVVGFCGSRCQIPPWLGSLFLWLGYISSTINPIIYTVFNKRFRQAFVRILRCQCFHPLRDSHTLYSRNFTTTIVPDTYTWSNHERATSVLCRDGSKSARGSEGVETSVNNKQRNDSSFLQFNKENTNKKTSLPSFPKCASSRDSRATTEETNTTDEENRPLLPKKDQNCQRMRKSITTFITSSSPVAVLSSSSLSTSSSSSAKSEKAAKSLISNAYVTKLNVTSTNIPIASYPNRSQSCADCKKADQMMSSALTDMTTSTISTSSASCPRHLTLFTDVDGSIRETFL